MFLVQVDMGTYTQSIDYSKVGLCLIIRTIYINWPKYIYNIADYYIISQNFLSLIFWA